MNEKLQLRLKSVEGHRTVAVNAVKAVTGLGKQAAEAIVDERRVVKQGVDETAAAEIDDLFHAANVEIEAEPTGTTSATTPHFEPPTPPEEIPTQSASALIGHLVDARSTDRGVPNAAIVAFAAGDTTEAIGSTLTNEEGGFVLAEFHETVSERFGAERPPIEFNAFIGDDELELSYAPFDWDALDDEGADVVLRVHATSDGTALRTTPFMPTTTVGNDDTVPAEFSVHGRITQETEPLVDATVRAFDIGLRSEQELGRAVTDTEGRYHIPYSSNELTRTEKRRAALQVRVYDELGEVAVSSAVKFDPATEETVDLTIKGVDRPSEHDRVRHTLDPLLDGVELAGVADDDVELLRYEVGGTHESAVEPLVDAARLATKTPFSESTLYALARELEADDIELDEAYLAESTADELVERVESAVEHGVVEPVAAGDVRTAHDRFIAAREVANRTEVRTRLRVLTATEQPASGYTVTFSNPEQDGKTRTFTVDDSGHVSFSYLQPKTGGTRSFDVTVRNPSGTVVTEARVTVGGESEPTITLESVSPGHAGRASVGSLSDLSGMTVDDEALGSVSEFTFADVRAAGGVRGLDSDVSDETAAAVDAVSRLELTTDVESSVALVNAGFESQHDIAATDLATFHSRVSGALSQTDAGRIHATATAQTYVLDNVFTARLTDLRAGHSVGVPEGGESDAE